jgi:hypothetical protein
MVSESECCGNMKFHDTSAAEPPPKLGICLPQRHKGRKEILISSPFGKFGKGGAVKNHAPPQANSENLP